MDGMNEPWDGAERRLAAASELAANVEALAVEAKMLSDQVRRLDRKRKVNLFTIIILIVAMVYVVLEQRSDDRLRRTQHLQALGSAVAVCGMQNVIRVQVGNLLAQEQNEGLVDVPGDPAESARRRAVLAAQQKEFGLFPCEALVQGEKVTIRLEYPSTIPVTTP